MRKEDYGLRGGSLGSDCPNTDSKNRRTRNVTPHLLTLPFIKGCPVTSDGYFGNSFRTSN